MNSFTSSLSSTMTKEELRSHIYLTLANLYEKPMHRNQFKQFTFDSTDEPIAQEVITEMLRNFIVEQIQPGVIRLTDIGYVLIQRDLNRMRAGSEGTATQAIKEPSPLQPPTQEEIFSISSALRRPDCITATRFIHGQSEIFWATEGLKDVTGYNLKELNQAGGSLALITDIRKLEQIALRVLNGEEVLDETEILTLSGRKRKIKFLTRPRYDSDGHIAGTISALKVI